MNFYASAQRNLTYFGLLLGLITVCVIGEEIGQQSQGQAQVKGITQEAQAKIAALRADRAVKDEQAKLGVPAFKELVITDFAWGVSPPFGINQIQRFLPKNQHVILRDANGLCFGSVSKKGALTTIEDSSTACNTHIKPASNP